MDKCVQSLDDPKMVGRDKHRWLKVVITDYELWHSSDCMHVSGPLCCAFNCTAFMHCFFRSGATIRLVVMDRVSNSCKPDFDYLETTALFLDLCDRGLLRVDRPAPIECRRPPPKHAGLTIFDAQNLKEHTLESFSFNKTEPVKRAVIALQGQVEMQTPRFFANQCAFDILPRFLP